MQHVYIDGTKLEANADKYCWIWRKGTEKSRYRLFEKVTLMLGEINEEIAYTAFILTQARNIRLSSCKNWQSGMQTWRG